MRITTTRKKKQVKPRHLAPVSPNTHLCELHSFFKKVKEHTSNKLIERIEKRLRTTLSNMVPVKTSQLGTQECSDDSSTKYYGNVNGDEKVYIVVGKVLDDDKCVKLPKVTLCCLKISKEAEEKIKRFGGEVHTLDEIFKFDLSKCVLVSNDASRRIKCRYYHNRTDGKTPLIKKMHKKKDVMKRPS